MPTDIRPKPDPEPSRFRRFMASTPPWFQWTVLAGMFAVGLGLVVFYFILVKGDPLAPVYAW